jgi:hypothetical protein
MRLHDLTRLLNVVLDVNADAGCAVESQAKDIRHTARNGERFAKLRAVRRFFIALRKD